MCVYLQQTLRDNDQALKYLKSMVIKLLNERNHSEKLIVVLLSALKQMYLKLKVADNKENINQQDLAFDDESNQMFNVRA